MNVSDRYSVIIAATEKLISEHGTPTPMQVLEKVRWSATLLEAAIGGAHSYLSRSAEIDPETARETAAALVAQLHAAAFGIGLAGLTLFISLPGGEALDVNELRKALGINLN